MNNKVVKLFSYCMFAMLPCLAQANDLAIYGIDSLQTIDDATGSTIRGEGYANSESVAMSSVQIFVFDSASGSSVNLSTSSVNKASDALASYDSGSTYDSGTGYDSEEMVYAATSVSESGVNLGQMDLWIGDFNISSSDISLGAWGTGLGW
ncbi:MAG: hypothetical protein P1U77_22930 [Rubripirellula sp.]|jgi:hypothetical protein|nr:hypothetical protein [Planctomycetaceae bacterium]MDF1844302.1 hypothetical protein [Rubripirellula sp.]